MCLAATPLFRAFSQWRHLPLYSVLLMRLRLALGFVVHTSLPGTVCSAVAFEVADAVVPATERKLSTYAA